MFTRQSLIANWPNSLVSKWYITYITNITNIIFLIFYPLQILLIIWRCYLKKCFSHFIYFQENDGIIVIRTATLLLVVTFTKDMYPAVCIEAAEKLGKLSLFYFIYFESLFISKLFSNRLVPDGVFCL